MTLDEYRAKGLHLPTILRDFHDQKDIFKQIGGMEYYGKEITWVEGHVYTIDYFLWIMAKYGYELRKVTRKVPRENIHEAIKARKEAEYRMFREELDKSRTPNQ